MKNLTANRNKSARAWIMRSTSKTTAATPKGKTAPKTTPTTESAPTPAVDVIETASTQWSNENVVVVQPAPLSKEALPGSAEYNEIYQILKDACAAAGVGEVVTAPEPTPKDDRGLVTFLTQRLDPRTDKWVDVYIERANGWVTPQNDSIAPLVVTDWLKTVPFHYPINGCTVTAHTPGKVLVKIESDESGLKTGLMYMAEKQAKFVKKYGGYPMDSKKFAEFLSMVRNSERGI